MPANIRTNLSPEYVHDLLLETYQMWMEFALGKSSIGGRMLKNPSGRYASAITADRGPEGNIIAVYIEPGHIGSKEAAIIEHGHGPVDLKQKMLRGRTSRKIYMRDPPISPMGSIPGGLRTLRSMTRQGGRTGMMRTYGPMRFIRRQARIWAETYRTSYSDNVRTMSRNSSGWIVCAISSSP